MAGLYPSTLASIRRYLLLLVCLACVATTTELWMMGHHEDPWQWAPLAVMTVSVAGALWVMATWSASAVRVFRVLMVVLMIAGAVGAVLHYRANMEFQLEMDPSLGGLALMEKVLHAKAPPSLAPGNMALVGLIGLVAVWRSDEKSS
jgi:cation transport ATPase